MQESSERWIRCIHLDSKKRDGNTVDFLLAAKRAKAAARRFLEPATGLHDVPETITIDKSGAHAAAIESIQADAGCDIQLRQTKYINNVAQHDHHAIKRIIRASVAARTIASPGVRRDLSPQDSQAACRALQPRR